MKFGEYLITKKLITKSDLDDALAVQKYQKQKIGRLLRDLGAIDQKNLNMALESYLNIKIPISITKLFESSINDNNLFLEIAKKHQAIPFLYKGITCFASIIFTDLLCEEYERVFNKNSKIFLIDEDSYSYLTTNLKIDNGGSQHTFHIVNEKSDSERLQEKEAYTQIFRECIKFCKENGASDIHIEPNSEGLLIRVRIHGDLDIWRKLNLEHKDQLITTIKRLINLDLAIVGEPQDGRATFEDFKVDIRANSLPTLYGEKLVLRLLDQEQSFDIEKIGFDEETLNNLKEILRKSHGLILISGPTGSGKTTTLYSMINFLNLKESNISTLENPIEYRLDGINQVGISNYLSFADGLRALMRQDPDIILVGEIRDKETANLCFQAAATGHLVLSTVHANGALEVIDRLKNLGIDELTLKSNLIMSAAQRLLKKICPNCSRNDQERTGLKFRNIKGCKECKNGVVGRIPVLEFINFKNNSTIPNKTLKEQITELTFNGLIDVGEISRAS